MMLLVKKKKTGIQLLRFNILSSKQKNHRKNCPVFSEYLNRNIFGFSAVESLHYYKHVMTHGALCLLPARE
jgi:hypothetical protein